MAENDRDCQSQKKVLTHAIDTLRVREIGFKGGLRDSVQAAFSKRMGNTVL